MARRHQPASISHNRRRPPDPHSAPFRYIPAHHRHPHGQRDRLAQPHPVGIAPSGHGDEHLREGKQGHGGGDAESGVVTVHVVKRSESH